MMSINDKEQGFGIGLRPCYQVEIIETQPDLDWIEITTENFLVEGGRVLYYLRQLQEQYPMAMHGVSLSIGSTDELDLDYLQRVKQLADDIQPLWISDHLCWTGVNGFNAHDLLPLPYTEDAINHVVNRVKQVQDFLGQQILLENLSSYITYQQSSLSEWEFLTAIAEQADCLILLDVNNIYVSAVNHDFDPMQYLNHIPPQRVQQFHLAGHERYPEYILDTHSATICPDVWQLYEAACRLFPKAATLIERDDNYPPLAELMTELNEARRIHAHITKERVNE